MKIDKLISILEKQESMLHFPHFNRKDALELGQSMASRVLKENLVLAVSIRLANGLTVFQYGPEGTTPDNEYWMSRKFNIVRDFETSSLLLTLRLQKEKRTRESIDLDPQRYVLCGGGFPIRIAGSGVIGAVAVSGQPQFFDHAFIVDSVSRFLKVQDVPQISPNVKIG